MDAVCETLLESIMAAKWLKNKKTGKLIKIDESQFATFGVDLKSEDSEWESSEAPAAKEDKKIINKAPPLDVVLMGKDDEVIRVGDAQVHIFKGRGWKVLVDQTLVEPEVDSSTEEEADIDPVVISDDEVTNFLASLDPNDDDSWEDDGTVKQSILDSKFGEGIVDQAKVQTAWEGFTKAELT